MKTTISFFILVLSFSLIVSCSSSLESDNFIPDSRIDFFTGSAAQIFETYPDSLYPVPFSIDSISRVNDLLKIDVKYGGGEGECPSHLFVVQWDEQVHDTPENKPLIIFGLAHFITTPYNCEALVEERLKIDMTKLLDDQLNDSLSIKVFNVNPLY